MEENNSTETYVESGEQEGVVDLQSENPDDFKMVDEETGEPVEEDTEKPDEGNAEPVIQQSAEDNHAAKLARLKAERDARKREEESKAETDRLIRESGAVNPYTDKPFESMEEFLAYGKKVREAELKAKSEESGKTVEELEEEEEIRKEIARRKSKEPTVTKKDEEKATEDLIEIMEKHPDVKVETLLKNEKFLKFCGSRLGNESLNGLYEDYAELVHDAERSAKADTRAERSTGSGASGGERLTASQRRSLDAWNEANPDMQMTPSEYLKRD